MKKLFLFFSISFCLLILASCQKRVSPLELAVRDYASEIRPAFLQDDPASKDTLYLWAYFVYLYDWRYFQYHIKDSLNCPKVALTIGGNTYGIDYPDFGRFMPPPLPPPPMPDVIEQLQITDDAEPGADDEEPSITTMSIQSQKYEVDSIEEYKRYTEHYSFLKTYETMVFGAPKADLDTFQYYQEAFDHYEERDRALYHAIDSLYLLAPDVIGYTTFGRIHIVILAEEGVDKKYVDTFLHGVKVQDLRPRFIYYKKHESEKDDYQGGWGRHLVYGIEQNGQFKQIGRYLID